MEQGFFRWVWRFNGLALALTILVFVASSLFNEVWRGLYYMPAQNAVALPDAADGTQPDDLSETLSLQPRERVAGTNKLRLQLLKEQAGIGEYSSDGVYRSVANVGFLDLTNGETSWLFDASDRLVTMESYFSWPATPGEGQEAAPIAALYLLTVADSSGDGRLSYSDLQEAWISAPDGSGLRKVAEGIDRLQGSGMTDAETGYLVLTDAKGMHLVLFDAVTGQPRGRWPLSLPSAGN